MWDECYVVEEYVYGIEFNVFLKEYVQWLVGLVLSVVEGEGCNVVFFVLLGLEVFGVDGFVVGLVKVCWLVEVKGVLIDILVVDLVDYELLVVVFGVVVLIFVYLFSCVCGRFNCLLECLL